MDEKVVSREEMFKGASWSLCEGRFHKYAEKHAYSHGSKESVMGF